MTNVVPLQHKRSPSEARALAAWERAMRGEGMTLAEASATLRAIRYNRNWTPEELFAAVPSDMVDQVQTALTIAAGAQIAEADALDAYMSEHSGAA